MISLAEDLMTGPCMGQIAVTTIALLFDNPILNFPKVPDWPSSSACWADLNPALRASITDIRENTGAEMTFKRSKAPAKIA